MDTVTISPKYQVVIPARIREDMNLHPGEKVMMMEKDGVIHMIRVGNIENLKGQFKKLTLEGLRDEEDRFAE